MDPQQLIFALQSLPPEILMAVIRDAAEGNARNNGLLWQQTETHWGARADLVGVYLLTKGKCY